MYSYEISNILCKNNYIITSEIYTKLITTSPQINHVKYDPYSNNFEMWDEENHWNFKVKKERNKENDSDN